MRRLTSPAALFAIWTLLFLLPVLPIAIRRVTQPHVTHVVALPVPELMPSFALLAALMPVLRFAPLSYPFFAVVFAVWPLVTRRPLDAVLGRWQFGLATLPAIAGVLIGATILGWNRSKTAGAWSFETPAHTIVLEEIFCTVAAFWLGSLALFCYNVVYTSRHRASKIASS